MATTGAFYFQVFPIIFIILYTLYSTILPISRIINFFGAIWALVTLTWYLVQWLKDRLPTTYVSPKDKIILITGCDSGFGFLAAKQLDSYGFHVYAACLDPDSEGPRKLKTSCSTKLKIVQMDVTNDEDVNSVVEEIKISGLVFWALINNAGISSNGKIEWGHGIDQFDMQYKVNVLGTVRVTKACLPQLRKWRGRVINMSSMAGELC